MAQLWGSDAMRLQLRDFMVPHLPGSIDLTFSGLPLGGPRPLRTLIFQTWLKTRRPAIFILLKHVAQRITSAELAQIKEKAIAVGVDHKDSTLSRVDLVQYDFHISSTETGRRAIEALLDEDCVGSTSRPAVEVLFQSHDRRLETLQLMPPDRVSAVYLGLPANAAIPETLSDDIEIIEVVRNQDMDRAMGELGRHNFHYAVRPDPAKTLRRTYKPFTKGVTAAACRSNILVNRQVDDAVEFLTPDYPYLLESNAPEHVVEGFRKAQEEFGGPEWHRGLEIMRSVRERVSGPAQARQFAAIVTRAAERAEHPVMSGRKEGLAAAFPPAATDLGKVKAVE
ncbi:hypothetical protein [Pararhodobacter sp. SW119]|uniref:hypothetical protein n=1 Tax=Pararhodobacter sp. SW119 TaxID=2780075 RepID=UPI001ADF15C1|nr:hypothetical protein [Pararhodobacter sp. SW119]